MASAASNIKRVVTQRGKNSLQIEREKFESNQVASIIKAVNENEVPAKEKHIRVALLGTYKDQSSSLFWRVVTTQIQLQGNPIVCWKFCHVVHKLFREGHPKCIEESRRYTHLLKELGKLWRHLREGYGRLIAFYTKLLLQKLSFHEKNPEFPGNLYLDEEQFEKIVGTDVNTYFELSVDMLDYMDDILALQSAVFGSLDMSRSNSMTNSGQCRLSPLIQCIQDSCQLYDYCVKILFKLHSSLPPDTLGGHRDRFSQQYKTLKEFYHHSSNLQYFKNLIKVPILPERPPNFLQASNLHLHVKPVAIVPEPEPEVADVQEETIVDTLIDTSSTTSSSQDEVSMEPSPQQQRNGAPSPALPDERDLMISRLLHEVNELKRELARVKAEDRVIIESLHNRLKELEMELSELRQIAESTQEENETLKTALKQGEKNTVTIDRLTTMEKVAKVNDEKFKKMKDIYQKLRAEHVNLLRSNADVKKDMSQLEREKEDTETRLQSVEQSLFELQRDKEVIEQNLEQSAEESSQQRSDAETLKKLLEGDKQSLEQELRELESAKGSLEKSLEQCRAEFEALGQRLDQSQTQHKNTEESMKTDLENTRLKMLVSAVEEGENIIRDALDQSENPHHHSVTGTAEYLLHRAEPVLKSLTTLRDSCEHLQQDKEALSEVIKSICDFSHRLSETIVQGFATSHGTASIEHGQDLSDQCKDSGEEGLKLLALLKQDDLSGVPAQSDRVRELIEQIMSHAEELLPKIEDVQAEQMGDLVEREMQQTSEAIEKAAAKIAEMLAKSREDQSGVQLEVNEKILDSCNGLMKAIKILVHKSKNLQNEIVGQGRGSVSQKEFYKKHHRWTDGLLSAAKTVGWGANILVEAADKVVKGEGKFEELVVCSQEIAASTTQLVVSSKVKADKNSKKLRELSEASKGVTTATGQVVASSKAGAQMIEDLSDMDFSQLTLHQAKRQEMESQVRVLELESDLEKERKKLMELRKTHYQLAGESEGWDQEDIDSQTSK